MSGILIVDDEAAIRSLLGEVFRDEGFSVREAEHGLQAVALALQLPPDLILMDLAMPVMDGITASGQLKQDPRTQHARIIALSAQTQRIGASERAWFDAVVDKPFDLDRLLLLVDAQLSGMRFRAL